MARLLTEQEREQFLAGLHVGLLSVTGESGRPPLAMPVWYSYQPGGMLSFFTGTQGRKARKIELIQKAGVLSLSVQREEFPYKYVTVEGTVVKTDQPPPAEQMLSIVRRYLPEEAAQAFVTMELARPGNALVIYTVRPDRWWTGDFSDDVGKPPSAD